MTKLRPSYSERARRGIVWEKWAFHRSQRCDRRGQVGYCVVVTVVFDANLASKEQVAPASDKFPTAVMAFDDLNNHPKFSIRPGRCH
jgi:hypothetical protein